MSDKPKPISDERLEQLYGAYFHLRLTGVAPNVEWDDFRERESAYGELQQRRELASRATPGWPILLNVAQELAAKEWAADDRLWTTQETVEFNLRTFARKILALSASPSPQTDDPGDLPGPALLLDEVQP